MVASRHSRTPALLMWLRQEPPFATGTSDRVPAREFMDDAAFQIFLT
jgi:hypothetical protein